MFIHHFRRGKVKFVRVFVAKDSSFFTLLAWFERREKFFPVSKFLILTRCRSFPTCGNDGLFVKLRLLGRYKYRWPEKALCSKQKKIVNEELDA